VVSLESSVLAVELISLDAQKICANDEKKHTQKGTTMKRVTYMVFVLALCGLAISSCKKKGKETKSASAEIAADTSELRKQVKKKIKDKIRRDNVLILVDDVDRIRGKLTLAFLDMQHKMQKNPTMSREEIEAIFKDFEGLRMDALREMATARLAMREHVNEEEWKKIFPEKKKKEDADEAPGETGEEEPGGEVPEAEESSNVLEKPEREE
jgi:hypothetical protein